MEESNETLALLAQKDDRQAVSTLWKRVQSLLYLKAFRYYNSQKEACAGAGVALDDLQQECFLAMLNAVQDYDKEKSFKFTTYLNFHTKNRFNFLLGRRGATRALNIADSLDRLISDEDESLSLSDTIADDNAEQAFENADHHDYLRALHEALTRALIVLPEPERRIITARYYGGKNGAEIARIEGLTYEQERKFEVSALKQLRAWKIRRTLSEFMDYGAGYGGTGLTAWKRNGSVEERILERAEMRATQKLEPFQNQ